MKRHGAIANFMLGAIVLAAILFQSFHALEHLAEAFSEKQCRHQYAAKQDQVDHSHHDFEHCFKCEFTLSPAISNIFVEFHSYQSPISTSLEFYFDKQITLSFSGSLLTLRGPPSV